MWWRPAEIRCPEGPMVSAEWAYILPLWNHIHGVAKADFTLNKAVVLSGAIPLVHPGFRRVEGGIVSAVSHPGGNVAREEGGIDPDVAPARLARVVDAGEEWCWEFHLKASILEGILVLIWWEENQSREGETCERARGGSGGLEVGGGSMDGGTRLPISRTTAFRAHSRLTQGAACPGPIPETRTTEHCHRGSAP